MRVLTVIPARAGSKRLPGKNRELVGYRGLVERAICHAHGAGLDPIVVSDDKELRGLVHGLCRWMQEPADLAMDDTPMTRVVRWAIRNQLEEIEKVVVLQPTSPFREPGDIKACLEIHRRSGCDSVVSVTADLKSKMYKRNGAVYVATRELVNSGNLLGGWTNFYVMPSERSIDIDTVADLDEARRLAGDS